MARSDKTPGDGKMTVMIFQLEGSNATLQEGFRTISHALDNVLDHRAKTKFLTTNPGTKNAPLDPNVIEDPSDESIVEEEVTPNTGTLSRARRFRSPKIVDIDLLSGDQPLKGFLEPHEATGINKKYLLTAYWLKKYRQIDEVKADHIHTCFRHMTWATPKEAAQPLREMKSSRKFQWFNKGMEKGFYAINHVGENMAESIVKGEIK